MHPTRFPDSFSGDLFRIIGRVKRKFCIAWEMCDFDGDQSGSGDSNALDVVSHE